MNGSVAPTSCADPGIFARGGGGGGGVQVSLIKISSFFFSLQLILQKSNGQFLSFFKVPVGSNIFQLFPEGSNCLFPI